MRRPVTPDEANGIMYARTLEEHGWLNGFRVAAQRYVDDGHGRYPSPVRWGWMLWLRLTGNTFLGGRGLVSPIGSLGMMVSGRLLPDAHVALFTILALFAAHAGNSWTTALAMLGALAFREASGLIAPAVLAAWLLAGFSPVLGITTIAFAVVEWVAITGFLLGRGFLPTLKKALSGHDHDYTIREQRGGPHRLLVDLVMVSPVTTLLAVYGVQFAPWLAICAALIFGVHVFAPVRNVRTIVSVDILLRILAAYALLNTVVPVAIPLACVWVAFDVYVYMRIRNLIDPVTSSLAVTFGMVNRKEPDGTAKV